MDSYLSPSDTSTELRPTGLDSLAGHSNGHDSAPLPATDFVRLHHSLMSHDNGRRSTFHNKFHVASHGDSHDSTPLLFMINSSSSRAAHDEAVTNNRYQSVAPSAYKKGGPRYVIL